MLPKQAATGFYSAIPEDAAAKLAIELFKQKSPEERGEVARLNDEFRRTTNQIMITPGIQALPDVLGLVEAVRAFDDFTPDNDPWGEHDFGGLDWHNDRVFWKIDYYDQNLQYAEDPLLPECQRVLTVLLASEY